jgi:hypothetical protein
MDEGWNVKDVYLITSRGSLFLYMALCWVPPPSRFLHLISFSDVIV